MFKAVDIAEYDEHHVVGWELHLIFQRRVPTVATASTVAITTLTAAFAPSFTASASLALAAATSTAT